MKVLVLGASGMIGSAMFRVLSADQNLQVWGTIRSSGAKHFFSEAKRERLIADLHVENQEMLIRLFARIRPDVVVNCVGLTKHHKEAEDPMLALPVNSLLPHRLADLCALAVARLIHVSTDCVFAGTKGNYSEADAPDALDVYGKSKHLGEVSHPNAITLRTSTIGHELQSSYGLLEWFLAQQGSCKGFARAIFSGLPNTEFARVVRDVVIPRAEMHGLYHLGAQPIDKYSLLKLIASTYSRQVDIVRDDQFSMDRSLNSDRFRNATGYVSAEWPQLIGEMYASK